MRHDRQTRPEMNLTAQSPRADTRHDRDADLLVDIRREETLKSTGQWNDPEGEAKNLRELNEFVATLTPLPKEDKSFKSNAWILKAIRKPGFSLSHRRVKEMIQGANPGARKPCENRTDPI